MDTATLGLVLMTLGAILTHLAWHIRTREDLREWVQDVIAQEIRRQDDRIQKRLERIPRGHSDVDATAFDPPQIVEGLNGVAAGQPYRR